MSRPVRENRLKTIAEKRKPQFQENTIEAERRSLTVYRIELENGGTGAHRYRVTKEMQYIVLQLCSKKTWCKQSSSSDKKTTVIYSLKFI